MSEEFGSMTDAERMRRYPNRTKDGYMRGVALRAQADEAQEPYLRTATKIADVLANDLGAEITSLTGELVYYKHLDGEGGGGYISGSFPAEWLWSEEWAEILIAKDAADAAAKKRRDLDLQSRLSAQTKKDHRDVVEALKKKYLKKG